MIEQQFVIKSEEGRQYLTIDKDCFMLRWVDDVKLATTFNEKDCCNYVNYLTQIFDTYYGVIKVVRKPPEYVVYFVDAHGCNNYYRSFKHHFDIVQTTLVWDTQFAHASVYSEKDAIKISEALSVIMNRPVKYIQKYLDDGDDLV